MILTKTETAEKARIDRKVFACSATRHDTTDMTERDLLAVLLSPTSSPAQKIAAREERAKRASTKEGTDHDK